MKKFLFTILNRYLYLYGLHNSNHIYHVVTAEYADDDMTSPQSLHYDFETIEVATDNFSWSNKLGEGGFGEVYKVCICEL